MRKYSKTRMREPWLRRSITVCVWLFTVVSAAHEYSGRLRTTGDHRSCKFIPNTSSLSCPCTMSWSQIMWLHNLQQFQDNCTRGKGNGLHCQIAREARVEAGGLTLNYTRVIPGTVYCEIYNNTSGVEDPSQRTQVDWLSISPEMTARKPVSNTTSAHMEIVIPVAVLGVIILVALVLILWRQRRIMCRRLLDWMEMRRVPTAQGDPIIISVETSSSTSISDLLNLQGSRGICSNLSNHSACPQSHSVSPWLSLRCDPSLPVVQSAELYTLIPVQSDQYLVKF